MEYIVTYYNVYNPVRYHGTIPSSSDEGHHKLTNFDGSLVGVTNSRGFRCEDWASDPVDVGTNGPETGVSPVPPSIRLSKLKIPVEGVEIGMPLKSLIRAPAKV